MVLSIRVSRAGRVSRVRVTLNVTVRVSRVRIMVSVRERYSSAVPGMAMLRI